MVRSGAQEEGVEETSWVKMGKWETQLGKYVVGWLWIK